MTAIWHQKDGKWGLLSPAGFEDEDALHTLVERSPELLPLAGSPRLAILGREVRLGSGSADLFGMEPDGRPVILEIKLKANPEARRAVIAQVLAYASYLYRSSYEDLESGTLGKHLQQMGFQTIADALANQAQLEVDPSLLREQVQAHLNSGSFRLVLVLDEVPPELVRLVGYLEAVGTGITLDLVSISSYQVGADRVVVPQKVEPERLAIQALGGPTKSKSPDPISSPGTGDFDAVVEAVAISDRPRMRMLADWASAMAEQGLATVGTTHGVRRKTIWVRVKGTDSGLATLVTDYGGSIWLWPTVFARRAPRALAELEAELGSPLPVLKPDSWDASFLTKLTSAYREAIEAPTSVSLS